MCLCKATVSLPILQRLKLRWITYYLVFQWLCYSITSVCREEEIVKGIFENSKVYKGRAYESSICNPFSQTPLAPSCCWSLIKLRTTSLRFALKQLFFCFLADGERLCSCYSFNNQLNGFMWPQANGNCKYYDKNLVVMETEKEWEFIKNAIQNLAGSKYGEWFIGLEINLTTESWTRINGETSYYWQMGEVKSLPGWLFRDDSRGISNWN